MAAPSHINLLFALPVAIISLPAFGLVAIHNDPAAYNFILDGMPYTEQPLHMYLIFIAVYLATWFLLNRAFGVTRVHIPPLNKKGKIGLSAILVASLALTPIAANISVFDVVSGEVGKSDVRESGSLIGILAKYCLPVLFAYVCLIYRYERHRISLLSVVIVGILTLVAGLTLGGKASAIRVLLPGIIALVLAGMRWRTTILFGSVAIAAIIVAGLYLDPFLRGGSLRDSANYVSRRAFILTAEVPYRATERTINGERFDYLPTLGAAATNSVILRLIDNPDEIYKYQFARAVSALLYPDMIDDVNDGRWNHTPSVFVESVLAFGLRMYWLFAPLVALVMWSLNRRIKVCVSKARYPSAAVLLGYTVTVGLTWLISGGIATLVHPLIILSFTAVMVALLLIDRLPIDLGGRKISRPASTSPLP